ncbi:RagB/SusD family nutrient uptake outer membrane protein [Parabacteroides sp. AM58-2XD]|uniref:RagB/SusD family nutrient uptake outer membrane protein n=1 Tax=Parabacteroides TaxID=375288 RepID=UPI000FE1974B|nr:MULTISPECIES: RagB/SusD family nutrient uptake outer membrane protein [Parabacteroides]MCM0717404.1 RagB/SusD family nutrient uptake outer membrane protein [Parabacteroides sp. W1-Q-101]RGY97449.1 RagB/SusD family nutrient uptake outer membrane protein [Parabacteroides sp. AM58-2XD]
MKKVYYIASMSLLLGFSACNNDFMDLYPEDKINDETYWKTESDLKNFANQFYTTLDNTGIYNSDNASDNQAPQSKDNFVWSDYTIPTAGGGWAKGDWANIRSCNYFLSRYHTVEGNAEKINQYVGEIYFFKAKFYYEKVLRFGDVPWLTTDLTTSSEELYNPRNDRGAVIDSICACLDKASEWLPETMQDSRLSKYAALTLKSRVCLFEGTWRKYRNLENADKYLRISVDAAEKIINSGNFTVYSTGNIEDDYHALFNQQDYSNNKEAIFFAAYVTDKRMNNRPRTVRESYTGMTKDFVESFLCDDGKPIALSDRYKGDVKFTDEFENRDPRLKQCIYTPERPIAILADGSEEYENSPVFSNLSNTGYRLYKMYSPLAEDNEYIKCTLDDLIYRYGEVLLNYAEAKAELGECDQAVLDKTINKLRDRVGMKHLTTDVGFTDPNWPKWEVPISPLLNEIRRERRVELACEGLRWNDLCRWKAGKLLENIKTYLGPRDPATGEYRVVYPGMTRTWYDRLYLYPIPTDEFTYNPNLLPQNPGWAN